VVSGATHGGPAFPIALNPGEGYDAGKLGPADGMSLRDYFAAKAMQGITTADAKGRYTEADIAGIAYAIADAMLKERQA